MRGNSTREHIKLVARRLFARRGIDGVTVREIVAASEQKNAGSLHYYFRTKEALIRELIVDTARLIDERRNASLDQLEAAGGPHRLRQILEVLVLPSLNLGEADGETGGEEDTYLRFISLLALQNRALLDEVLEGGLNTGYQRCLGHIRRLAANVPPAVLAQRLVFMSISLRAILAAREASLDQRADPHHFWASPDTLKNLLDALQGMVNAPSFIEEDEP
ncbi:MAG: transcriptional regulator, TetR family [Polaromonas sp.]|nr:transcriptional regulator, TetR family [Polaromonas sp.]